MKKIYESDLCGWDERAEQIIIYELEEGEYEELSLEMDRDGGGEQLLNSLGYYSDWYPVPEGAPYVQYYIENITTHHLIISEYHFLNV